VQPASKITDLCDAYLAHTHGIVQASYDRVGTGTSRTRTHVCALHVTFGFRTKARQKFHPRLIHRRKSRCARAIRSLRSFRLRSAGISNNFRMTSSRAAFNRCSDRSCGRSEGDRGIASAIELNVVIASAISLPPLTSFSGCRSRTLTYPFFVRRQTDRITLTLACLSCILHSAAARRSNKNPCLKSRQFVGNFKTDAACQGRTNRIV
jgi:hypothetical protein